jgi:putative salt-induced outer membrane protein
MKKTLLASALMLALPLAAFADGPAPTPADGEWHGSGEAGLALASGNAKSQNINLKLTLKKEDDRWKYDFFLEGIRNKADVTTTTDVVNNGTNPPTVTPQTTTNYQTTANRYDGGASAGFKFDDRSYIVGAVRYDHDEFSPYEYQYTVSIGYGYQVLKNASNELSFEIGPGYRVQQPLAYFDTTVGSYVKPDSSDSIVARGLMSYKHNFNDTTSFTDTLLVESGGGNTYTQNDAGLMVKMSDKLALKAGYQVRHNSTIPYGSTFTKKTDQLLTTNLVYGF